MEQWQKTLFTVLQTIIWLTFTVAIYDPGEMGTRPSDSIYATYATIFDVLYTVTGYILAPVQTIFQILGLYKPGITTGWFPITSAKDWSQLTSAIGWGNTFTPKSFEGGIIWWIPITSVGIVIFALLFSYFFDKCKNFIWNIVIEYVFHQKKTKQYAAALHRKETELVLVNTRYRAMAQETYSLKDSVITDELTAIYNKRFFLNRVQQEFAHCKKEKLLFSLIMIDIDFFKRLNDTYGHLAGDQVLKSVAAVIKRFSPESCYPCRYGGEEFSIVMPRKTKTQGLEAARLLQENIQLLRFEMIDPKLRITVSQGICTIDFSTPAGQGIKSVDTFLELADKELYRSKSEGRNRVSSCSVGI